MQDPRLLTLHYHRVRSWTTHPSLPSCKILNYSPFTTILQDPKLLPLHYHLARCGTTHTSLPPCKIRNYSLFTTSLQDPELLTLHHHLAKSWTIHCANPNNPVVTKLGAEQPSHEGSVLELGKRFYFLRSVQCRGCLFYGVKWCVQLTVHFRFVPKLRMSDFTAVCLQGVEISSPEGNLTSRKHCLQRSSQFFWRTCICICLMSYFKIQFHCTVVGKLAHWCYCCVTHAIGSRDMPAVRTTFHFVSNSLAGFQRTFYFLIRQDHSLLVLLFETDPVLYKKNTISWGYINIIF